MTDIPAWLREYEQQAKDPATTPPPDRPCGLGGNSCPSDPKQVAKCPEC